VGLIAAGAVVGIIAPTFVVADLIDAVGASARQAGRTAVLAGVRCVV
jgi:hypothetical protein